MLNVVKFNTVKFTVKIRLDRKYSLLQECDKDSYHKSYGTMISERLFKLES